MIGIANTNTIGRQQKGGSYVPPSVVNTTPDGKRVVLVIGDSRMQGSSEAAGPTPALNTVFEFFNGVEIPIAATDTHNAALGSPWPQMGITHNTRTSGVNKLVFVARGSAGSEYSPNGDNNNWSTSGSLYTPAIAECDAALTYYNLTDPYLIIVGLGVNDANGVGTLPTIQSDVQSLYSRLTAKYPNTDIYTINTGRTSGGLAGSRLVAINDYINQESLSRTRLYRAVNLTSFFGWGMYGGDNLHLTQAGNNYLGTMLDRMLTSSEPNKQVREITNWYYSDISTANKAVIKTLYEGMVADGNWTGTMDSFQPYFGTQHVNDAYVEWRWTHAPFSLGLTIHPGSDIETAGVAGSYMDSSTILGQQVNLNNSDYVKAWGFKTVFSAAGTSAHGATSNAAERCFQAASNVIAYGCADATATTWVGGDTKFQDNTEYANGRNGTTKFLRKNGVQVHSATVAGSAFSATDSVVVGSGRPAGNYMNGQYRYFYAAKQSTLNHVALYNRLQTAIANWTI